MALVLVGLAVAFGCFGLAAGYFFRRAAQRSRRGLERVQLDLHKAREELKGTQQRYQELVDTPPVPTNSQFVDHLLALHAGIAERAQSLEDWRIKSAQPFQEIAEEAEKSRTDSRRERFVQFRERLQNANVQINIHIERLSAAHSLILTIADSLKAGHLDALVGNHDIHEISAVLRAFAQQEWPTDDSRGLLHRQTDEFSSRLKAYDRMKDIDRRQREEDRAAAALAFSRYKLPPLTPFEKFRALKSGGQRDNLG